MSALPATFVKSFHDEELVRRMEYCQFGKTSLQISKISYGCGTFSNVYGELDLDEAIKCIHQAIKSGINYIDTAPLYGEGRSEEVLGLALKDVPREAYYVATKVGRYRMEMENMMDFSAKKTRESVELSLKRLGLDYVDVIQIHDIEFSEDLDIIINETLPTLEQFVKEGKAKYIGVTGYPISVLKKFLEMTPGRFDMVLCYARYTLLDDTLLQYMDFFTKEKLGIVCASAHALGILTNGGPQSWHPGDEEIKALGRKAADICKDRGVELGKLAMHHALQLDGATTFLTGMQTRRLLDINLSAYYNGLTAKEQEVLQYLRENVFTKSMNWEGNEVERYRTYLKQQVKH